MRILLVYPSQIDDGGAVVKYRKAFLPPLTLAVLDGLTPPGHDVRIVNDLVEDIPLDEPWDLVGITAMTIQADRAYQIADAFRERGVPVVIGGMHAAVVPEEVAQHADAIVIGEAEDLWPEILVDVENRRLQPVYKTEQFPDLANTVIPRWSNANMGVYAMPPGAKLPMMPIFTTRGCPNACKFCVVTRFYGHKHRVKTVGQVLKEIEATGATEYYFVDDNIAGQPDYAEELFRALKGKGIRWFSQASSTIMRHPHLVELAGEAGCMSLFLGLETTNQESLKTSGKSFNRAESYGDLFGLLRSAGIVPIGSFILGFDEDGPDAGQRLVEFVREWQLAFPIFWVLTPAPTTPLYDDLQAAGRTIDTPWSHYDGTHAVFRSKVPEAELEEMYWKSFRDAYSASNSLAAIRMNVRHAKNKPVELMRSLFIQGLFRSKVLRREHPLSGGFGRIGG